MLMESNLCPEDPSARLHPRTISLVARLSYPRDQSTLISPTLYLLLRSHCCEVWGRSHHGPVRVWYHQPSLKEGTPPGRRPSQLPSVNLKNFALNVNVKGNKQKLRSHKCKCRSCQLSKVSIPETLFSEIDYSVLSSRSVWVPVLHTTHVRGWGSRDPSGWRRGGVCCGEQPEDDKTLGLLWRRSHSFDFPPQSSVAAHSRGSSALSPS